MARRCGCSLCDEKRSPFDGRWLAHLSSRRAGSKPALDLTYRKVTYILSSMENNFSSNDSAASDGSPRDASALLSDLAADRAALADRLVAPGWLYPALGLMTALYVASPFVEPDVVRRSIAGFAIAGIIALVLGYQRMTGVRVSRAGGPARLTLWILLVATLLLLSVSLGLASFGLNWWIALTGAASFGLTVSLGRMFDRQYREHVRRGR